MEVSATIMLPLHTDYAFALYRTPLFVRLYIPNEIGACALTLVSPSLDLYCEGDSLAQRALTSSSSEVAITSAEVLLHTTALGF